MGGGEKVSGISAYQGIYLAFFQQIMVSRLNPIGYSELYIFISKSWRCRDPDYASITEAYVKSDNAEKEFGCQ